MRVRIIDEFDLNAQRLVSKLVMLVGNYIVWSMVYNRMVR